MRPLGAAHNVTVETQVPPPRARKPPSTHLEIQNLNQSFLGYRNYPGGGTWVLTVTLCAAPKGVIFSSSKYL